MMSRPTNLSKITINGEEYWPTPHEVNPNIPEDQVWTQYPPHELYLSDTEWYDAIGQDLIAQRRIWAIPSESGQVAAFEKLLADVPHRALDMMWAAALKGRPHVIRFLLGRGVRPMPVEANGDDVTLVPFHVAAAQGHLDCVKIFVEEARLPPDTLDDLGGTPLMRACFKSQPEVVRYLLSKGADLTVRQTASPDDSPGTSVFEFAAGGNSLACVKALLYRAQELEIEPYSLATPLALEAAAQSEEPEMLDLMLELGKYPAVNRQGSDEQEDITLTDSMKEAIESAFLRALKAERWDSLKSLRPYIYSRSPEGSYNWTHLKDETLDALWNGILAAVENDGEGNQALLIFLGDILLQKNSRLLSPKFRERRSENIGDAFFWACRFGSVAMLRILSEKYEKVDVNYLSHRVAPLMSSGLYIAAGSGENEVVDYLFLEHGGLPNLHLGHGKFANGTTPLWVAIWNGRPETSKKLLGRRGPVSELDDSIRTATEFPVTVVMTATMDYRAPVRLYLQDRWNKLFGETNGTMEDKGRIQDANENHMSYLAMTLEKEDMEWWDKIELRKSDEELLAMETNGRECKSDIACIEKKSELY